MTAALSAATVPSGSPLGSGISAIMAHATSTPDGDRAEAEAIRRLFSIGSGYAAANGDNRPFVISTKALTGHECWMSGVSQVVYALIQMQGGFVTPHINLQHPDEVAAALRIPTAPTITPLKTILCNAFGFGGTNSTLLLSRFK